MKNHIEYDDNNLKHVENGPDYGQINGKSIWNMEDSFEFKYINKFRGIDFFIEPIIYIDIN